MGLEIRKDPEIHDVLKASARHNVALDFLLGWVTFDPIVGVAQSLNLLYWHRQL